METTQYLFKIVMPYLVVVCSLVTINIYFIIQQQRVHAEWAILKLKNKLNMKYRSVQDLTFLSHHQKVKININWKRNYNWTLNQVLYFVCCILSFWFSSSQAAYSFMFGFSMSIWNIFVHWWLVCGPSKEPHYQWHVTNF